MLTSTRTTHVKEFKACRLSWRYTAVEKVPRARKDSFEFGTLVHRELEVWWLYGHLPQRPAARAVLAMLEPWLLERGIVRGEGRAEWNFKVVIAASLSGTVGGVAYGGQSDLVLVTSDGRVLVLDYKTSIDIDKYGLTDHQLANDLQLGVYASRVLDELAPEADGAIVAHVQIASRDSMDRMHDDPGFEPRVDIVHAWMPREKAQAIWDGAEAIVGQMIETAALPLADVPGNRDQCGEYGGCAYRTRCHVFAEAKKEDKMSGYQPGAIAPQLTAAGSIAAVLTAPQPWSAQRAGVQSGAFPAPPAPAAPLWVLIDVAPETGVAGLPQPVVHIDQILAPLQQQVAAENKVALYSMVKFAQGPKEVVAKLSQMQLSGTVLVDSMTPCANDVIEYLRPRAALVLRRSR